MSELIHMEKLESRYILDLSFKLESPLHIGCRVEGFTKLPLQFSVGGRRVPIVPAESLKGVLRNLASSLFSVALPQCELARYHRKDSHVREENLEELRQKYYELAKEELKRIFPEESVRDLDEGVVQLLEYYLTLRCPVCRLFGGKGVSAKLLISDGLPEGRVELFRYASTAIDRKTRIAAENRLFEVVSVKPDDGLRYRFRIIVDNVKKGSDDAILLSLLLDFVRRFGISVGGLKSRGYGRLALDEDRSSAIILKLVTDAGGNALHNVRALLLRDGYYERMNLKDFIGWLK
ncbi:MAG: RAMP superfamily CRISPR-associated protein [Candidatus Korarchaeum sp.]